MTSKIRPAPHDLRPVVVIVVVGSGWRFIVFTPGTLDLLLMNPLVSSCDQVQCACRTVKLTAAEEVQLNFTP